MSKRSISLAAVVAVTLAASLTACQDQRNEFNPVNVLCPGDFDPVTNKCVIRPPDDDD
jgi:hypothetical protein